ncbi:MAG: recombinase family protein [Aequoribacter sp.]|uniref:recombinase family protein n=1 Tax=Aequoribacter sp. TaxID=2847771 RepID=UPI003C43B76B
MKYEKGWSYKRITHWLNRSGIKTHRGKTWTKTGSSVHSLIKRMREREERIMFLSRELQKTYR